MGIEMWNADFYDFYRTQIFKIMMIHTDYFTKV